MSCAGVNKLMLSLLALQVNLDNTHATCKEGFNLCNLLTSFSGDHGSPVASIYLGDGFASTLQRALQWVKDVMEHSGIPLHPEVCFADDDKGEHRAVRATWPECQVR